MTAKRRKIDRSVTLLWRACLEGREPAESLSMEQRERLVVLLLDRGWPQALIAEHTQLSTYTTARICDRIRLRRLDATGERQRAG